MISAHWEEDDFKILNHDPYELLFDYYGFPEHTYELQYPAQGSKPIALRCQELLKQAGFSGEMIQNRGLDHGVFIPMLLIDPSASIPIVQISLRKDLDPAKHFQLGEILASLVADDVWIIGSGMSYHNLRALFQNFKNMERESREFDEWLAKTVTQSAPDQMRDQLIEWKNAPSAKQSHPREEHFIPLHVIAGCSYALRKNDSDSLGKIAFTDWLMGAKTSAIEFPI
jgi:aromatic ring-opening dioxygenase catalytic subunit (LigB family)